MPTGVTHLSEKTQRCHFFATVGAVWIGLYREPGGNIIRRVSPFHGDQSPGQLLRPEQLMCQSPHPLGPSPHTWMTWKREHCHSHLEKKEWEQSVTNETVRKSSNRFIWTHVRYVENFILLYTYKNKGSLLASMVLWRTLNIHGTFQLQNIFIYSRKMFFRFFKWFFKMVLLGTIEILKTFNMWL